MPETLVDAREDLMTETEFSKMSWFHKEDRLFQYSVVSEMTEAFIHRVLLLIQRRGGLIYTWLSESLARGSPDVHATPFQLAPKNQTLGADLKVCPSWTHSLSSTRPSKPSLQLTGRWEANPDGIKRVSHILSMCEKQRLIVICH